MSKDMLGSLVRVLVTVPEDRLGLVQDVALKLSNDDGEEWVSPLKKFLRKEEPHWPKEASGEKAHEVVIPEIPKGSKWVIDSEGTIYFEVISNGRTNEQWITYFENEKKDAKGQPNRVSDWGKNVLRRATDAPTEALTYKIAVRPGKKIKDSNRITRKIRKDAETRSWKTPHWEVAPLIRDFFTDEELEQLGLWYIVAMHEPIEDSDGDPYMLYANRDSVGRWLGADCGGPGGFWGGVGGFAFVVSQAVSVSVPQS